MGIQVINKQTHAYATNIENFITKIEIKHGALSYPAKT